MDSEAVENYRRAGKIAKQVVEFAKDFIKPRMKLIEIADAIDDKIAELGGEPAFPVNLSLNEIAAHYTPSADDETLAEGILKVDIGVEIDGCIADTAFSVDLTENGEFEEMMELNKKVLENVLNVLNEKSTISDVGNSVSKTVKQSGKKFTIIKNLSGHELEPFVIHAGETIPNFANENATPLKNKAIAIEPFLTTGVGEIYEGKPSEIFMLAEKGNIRDRDARQLLKYLEEKYLTKPFCKRWLVAKDLPKLNFSLALLVKSGIVYNFPILVEKSKKPVSQFEHTVIFHDGKAEVTTR